MTPALVCVAMSQEDVALIREVNARFNSDPQNAAQWIELYDPAIEFRMPAEWPEEPVYYGHEGVRRAAALWSENFDDYRWDEEHLIDCGDFVVGLWHTRGRIKDGGAWIEAPVGTIWHVRDAKIVRVVCYFTWAEALEAAGASDLELDHKGQSARS